LLFQFLVARQNTLHYGLKKSSVKMDFIGTQRLSFLAPYSFVGSCGTQEKLLKSI